mgnify:FL=1
MIEVKVENWNVQKVLEVVTDLRKMGYVQGLDFDFFYYPAKMIDFNPYSNYTGKYTIFKFKNEQLATYFYLKYYE